MKICIIIDIKSVPIVDLLMDQEMCAVLNAQPEQASVEPCITKRRFICIGKMICEKEDTKKPNLNKDHFQCTGN